jgi:tetratricopeptide (TPR) repeat protein
MSDSFQEGFSETPQGNDPFRDRFPDMQPITKVPSLSTVNGIGFTVYGKRDFDAETGTYVKTYVFCLLFIPLFAVRAYRVADAVPGWYFLGRVPLSGLAKFWNVLVLTLIVGGIGLGWWAHYSGTPEYKAGQLLAQADELAKEGKLEAAAKDYRTVALGSTSHAAAARSKLGELLDSGAAQNNPKEAVKALRIAVDVQHSGRNIDKLFERGLALAQKHCQKDPRAALDLADAVVPLNPNAKELIALRLPILQKLVAENRADVDLLSQLALVHEAKQDFTACEKLLAPYAAKLEDKEGARILGQIYARQGKIEEAYPLLQAYTENRLKAWRNVEQTQMETVKQVQREIVEELKNKTAPGFDFRGFQSAPEAEKNRILDDYFAMRLKDHPRYRKTQEEVRQVARVVPVALDFGIVLLRRGQGMADPAARKKELERAEKTFLAVRSAAGRLQEFNLFLGQVYYWLGRHDEGRKLFDQLLENKKTETMMDVAMALREVGAQSEARELAEKAYSQTTDPKKKYWAAEMCSVLALELDEKITWLGRADPNDRKVQADLANTRGQKALQESQDTEAAKHFREAVQIYGDMPESFLTLNNGALSQIGLFQVTGDRAALETALANLEKALALKPSDTILLHNVADSLLCRSLWDVIGKDIDLGALKRSGNIDLLQFLYRDSKSRVALRERVKNNPGVNKARSYYERLRVLAPKNPRIYSTLSRQYFFTDELDKLQELAKRLEETTLDQADAMRRQMEDYQGKNDVKLKKITAGVVGRLAENLHATL